MAKARKSVLQLVRQPRSLACFMACSLFLFAGCHTSEDAVSAATQMSVTAKCLSDYYTALNMILADTDQIYILNEQLFTKPYTPENRELLKNNRAELEKRAVLAADFSTLAGEFAKLTGSTAPDDVAKSSSKLEGEVETLEPMKASSEEKTALKVAVKLLVTAIQEHKEREAAKAMDSFTKGLSDFFVKEEPAYVSINQVYVEFAATLAGDLVDRHQTDNSAVLKVALDPFGLQPSVTSAELNTQLAPLARQRIAARKMALVKSFDTITDAMAKSLQEMSKRIDLVAEGKPMSSRSAPFTLATVQHWATQLGAF